ncbi:MAG: hypothetical protein CBD58_03755 [bacterium TMED198]|nr:MAG: hypothetical protein CBD58_03755 [bacterium TMED198]|tara:strand:- start:600 stop:1232 length:633 start_codon:yes stop_codon:yes gene_type:complete
MIKKIKVLFIVYFSIFSVSCSPTGKIVYINDISTDTRKVYDDFDDIFVSSIQTLQELNYVLDSTDKDGGVITAYKSSSNFKLENKSADETPFWVKVITGALIAGAVLFVLSIIFDDDSDEESKDDEHSHHHHHHYPDLDLHENNDQKTIRSYRLKVSILIQEQEDLLSIVTVQSLGEDLKNGIVVDTSPAVEQGLFDNYYNRLSSLINRD